MITLADAILNLLAAVGYFHFVAFLILDIAEDKRRARAPLTYLLLAIFLTCGAHHALHGWHLSEGHHDGHSLDVAVLSVQLFFIAIWVWLRYEAMFGGPGDRSVSPPGIVRSAWLGTYYPGVFIGSVVFAASHAVAFSIDVVFNGLIFLGYTAIALTLLHSQIKRQVQHGYWSLSGLAMAAYFMNCALSHAVFACLIVTGMYMPTRSMLVVDMLTVVPALAFPIIANMQRPKPKDMKASEAEPLA